MLASVAIAGGGWRSRAEAAGSAASTASVLLIGSGRPAALPALPNCEPALRDLGDRLRGQGDDVSVVIDVTGPALRAAIGRFAGQLQPGGRALVAFCGYAMTDADKLFLLPSDASMTAPVDLPRQAVIARAVSRVLATHDSIFLAELHATPSGQAADLSSAVQSLREETAPGTRLEIDVAPDAATAPVIEGFSKRVSPGSDWSALAEPAPSAAQAPSGADSSGPSTSPGPSAPAGAPAADVAAAQPAPPHAAPTATAPAPDSSAPAAPVTAASAAETAKSKPAATPKAAAKVAETASSASEPASPAPPASGSVPGVPASPAPADASKTPQPLHKPRPKPAPSDGGSPLIRHIQVALVARGLLKGDVTGRTDGATQGAIKAYQQALGHPPTGFLTYQEMNSLDRLSK